MSRTFAFVFLVVIFSAIFNVPAVAQDSGQSSEEKCEGNVYQPKEVSQHARITFKSEPVYTAEARARRVSGRVVLSAVLCRSGHVTDIQVIKSLPFGLTEKAIEAAKKIRFEPAQKDGDAVSQAIQLEYGFNVDPPGHRPLAKEPVDGRIVESLAVVGLVCQPRSEIWSHIRIRMGEPYHKEQSDQDLAALLALGYFDSKESSVRIEEAERGGIGVVFMLKELPQTTPCQK